MTRVFNTVMAGFGPANLGILIASYRRGLLADMAKGGLAILEASNRLGSGRLRDYRITANSLASVFLEVLDDPRLGGMFDSLEHDADVVKLRQHPNIAPNLGLVGSVLEKMAGTFLAAISKDHDVTVVCGAKVQSCTPAGELKQVKYFAENVLWKLQAKTVFINCGGKQAPLDGEVTGQLGEFMPSDELLCASDNGIVATLGTARAPRIAILGGSHSAVSSIIRLSECISNPDSSITVFSRTNVRIFYNSAADAEAAGYAFNPLQDVCPLSGRINRYSGLRYDSRRAALRIEETGAVSENAPRVSFMYDANPLERLAAAGHFDLRILATGYEAAGSFQGVEFGDGDGLLYTQDHAPFKNAFSFGLGSGLRPTPEIGGEPSFRGRLDGFWLYANDVGDAILNKYQRNLAS